MSVEVETLIGRIKALTPEQSIALTEAWDNNEDVSVRMNAWLHALQASEDGNRQREWKRAYRATTKASPRATILDWYEAQVVAWEAVAALVVRDLLTTEDFDALYGPWASVMEGKDGSDER